MVDIEIPPSAAHKHYLIHFETRRSHLACSMLMAFRPSPILMNRGTTVIPSQSLVFNGQNIIPTITIKMQKYGSFARSKTVTTCPVNKNRKYHTCFFELLNKFLGLQCSFSLPVLIQFLPFLQHEDVMSQIQATP